MFRDVRHGARSLARAPALAAVVIVSLAAGIGANTVVFSWIERIVLRPIAGAPDAGAFHLVEPRTADGLYTGTSWPEYRDLRDRLRAIDRLIAYRMAPLSVGAPGHVERGSGMLVSGNYFDALGLLPARGRLLLPDEAATPGGAPVAIVSHAFWQTRLGGRDDVVGTPLRVNGQELTIVGVAPPGFQGTVLGLSFDLWLPATLAPVLFDGSRELDDRSVRGYEVAGTIASATGVARARTELAAAMRELARMFPRTNAGVTAQLLPFWQSPRGPQRLMATSLVLLQAVMLLVLLTVCGNTATLLLARASVRRREMGLRLALGAPRWRLARLLLTESLLLALPGAALGALLAVWGVTALSAMPPMHVRGFPIAFQLYVDRSALGFAAALGVASAAISGALPALQLARVDPQVMLRAGTATESRSRLRNALVAFEVAVALVVLVAAGASLRSFLETRTLDTGFRRDGVLLAEYDLTLRRARPDAARDFARRLLARLRALPDVDAAAIATSVPLDIHGMPSAPFTVEGRAPAADAASRPEALINRATAGYFDVMAIPLAAGRDFSPLDAGAAPAEAIVNEAFVRRYVDPAPALGRGVEIRGRRYTIVGVARNSLYEAFGEPPTPIVYLSFRDRPAAVADLHLHVRAGAPAGLGSAIRRVVRDLDPELPVYDVRTLDEHIEANLLFRRIPARLFAGLAPLLLVLAAIGVYAVVAYSVSVRTAEVGVRRALGATGARVVRQFVGETLSVVAIGALAGWLLAFVLALDVLSGTIDLPVFAAVPLVLLAVAALACWIPSRRAARLDPAAALRHD